MTNLDKLIETLTQEELADMLEAVCINKNTFHLLDNEYSCDDCPFHNGDGRESCSKRQTKWLLEEYKTQIDWSRCGEVVILREGLYKNELFMINGILDGIVYIASEVTELHKTFSANGKLVPMYSTQCFAIDEGKTFQTYRNNWIYN